MVQSSRIFMCAPFVFYCFIDCWLACSIVRLFVLCMFVRPRDNGPRGTFRLVIESNPGMISKSLGSRVSQVSKVLGGQPPKRSEAMRSDAMLHLQIDLY